MWNYSRRQWAWAFYDWANSAFATTVMAGFFPIFFKSYWSAGTPATESTLWLGITNSVSSVAVAVCAPLLGAWVDRNGRHRGTLFGFTILGVTMTALLAVVPQGSWVAACVVFGFAAFGFMCSNSFYDALLVGVADPAARDRVSALGYSLGYLGGGLLFALNVAMTQWPPVFGLQNSAQAVQASFVMVAVWWLFFSIPLLIHRTRLQSHESNRRIGSVYRRIRNTFQDIRRHPNIGLFLLAYWIYIDGVDTVIRMAVDYGLSLGLPSSSLIVALLITQFVGFPAALLYGRVGEQLGEVRAILFGLGVYVVVVWAASRMTTALEFYVLAAAIGLVQGGIQALSRALYSRLIPVDQAAEYFGIYNMLGKFAAILGPLLVGWSGYAFGEPRLGILSLLVFFIVGGVLLSRVRVL